MQEAPNDWSDAHMEAPKHETPLDRSIDQAEWSAMHKDKVEHACERVAVKHRTTVDQGTTNPDSNQAKDQLVEARQGIQ